MKHCDVECIEPAKCMPYVCPVCFNVNICPKGVDGGGINHPSHVVAVRVKRKGHINLNMNDDMLTEKLIERFVVCATRRKLVRIDGLIYAVSEILEREIVEPHDFLHSRIIVTRVHVHARVLNTI